MIETARVVITRPRGRLETRTGVMYGNELETMLADLAANGVHAVAYAHNHAHGDPIVGEAQPNGTSWARATAPLADTGPRAS